MEMCQTSIPEEILRRRRMGFCSREYSSIEADTDLFSPYPEVPLCKLHTNNSVYVLLLSDIERTTFKVSNLALHSFQAYYGVNMHLSACPQCALY